MTPDIATKSTIRWMAEYAVGVEEIDHEHQRLFSLAETLHVAIREGRGEEKLDNLIDEFARRFDPQHGQRRTWISAADRPRRALLLSSPIGLGHAWRDVAIARELRRLVPGLEVHWLAREFHDAIKLQVSDRTIGVAHVVGVQPFANQGFDSQLFT